MHLPVHTSIVAVSSAMEPPGQRQRYKTQLE
jgi:hypothetical protein